MMVLCVHAESVQTTKDLQALGAAYKRRGRFIWSFLRGCQLSMVKALNR
jgi:hypothetical protein